MYLKLVDIDSFCQELPEIDNSKIFESGKFAKTGLFSQQIFGPIKSYCCACLKAGYKGRNCPESQCKICNVDITSSGERRKRYGRISLPFPIFNPVFYYIICMSKPSLKKIITNMLSYKNAYYYGDSDKIQKIGPSGRVEDSEGNVIEVEKLEGISGVLTILERIIEEEDSKPEVQFLRDNFQFARINNVVVIPPDFRPCGKNQHGVNVTDEINHFYSKLIVKSNHMKSLPYEVDENSDIFRTNFRSIQTSVISIYDYVLSKLSKKKGLIRANVLGKRVDFSGRAVISPDPTLNLDSCRIPYVMLLELQKPQLVTYLIKRRICKRYNQANKLIEDCIRTQDPSLFDIVNDFCKDKMCILNRQPTLHRLGMLAFNCFPHLGKTIQIHPMVCPPYNADFDGDAMAVYFPITPEGKKDVKDKIGIKNNLISPTDLTLVTTPNQDIILGIWAATTSNSEIKKEIKGEELPFELYLFNKCLPESYPVQTEPCNKKKLISILNDIAFKYSPTEVMETLDAIKRLGFTTSTLEGYSLGIDDLCSTDLNDIASNLTGDKHIDLPTLSSEPVMDAMKELPFATFIESGARGSWDQVKQLVLSRGYVSDASGTIRNSLIRSSLVKGLNQQEFCQSSWGARKGLLDTAMSTGDSGYLTRQLTYSTVSIELDSTKEDCGTTDTLPITVENNKMAKTLLWRYFVRSDGTLGRITRRNYKDFIGTTVKLRSPIYCKDTKICRKCYGDLYKIIHSNQIGIIATQAVGERTTQLVLRTFHTSGVASVNSDGTTDSQNDIVSGMALANKLFHSQYNR